MAMIVMIIIVLMVIRFKFERMVAKAMMMMEMMPILPMMVMIMIMVIRFKFERPVVKAGRKPHQCLTDDCPCYKCSGCTKKWTKRCPFFMF